MTDNQNSQSAGPGGPLLLQDQHLTQKLAHFNREEIPERIVHAVGIAAGGTFEVTHDVSGLTRAHFLGEVGRRTEVFARFSTVAGSRGAADSVRDPRGFAIKFYTEDGNYDLVGNNTPFFFIRDPLKFPDFIHTQKADPRTNRQEPDNVWDFFSLSPELTHQFTWLNGDRGRPTSVRHMDGFGSHTYSWVNASDDGHWVKYHWKTNQGIDSVTDDAAADAAGGADPTMHLQDLRQAIEAGDPPSWTLKVQVMPFADAQDYRFNPFDLTKVWPHADYPLSEDDLDAGEANCAHCGVTFEVALEDEDEEQEEGPVQYEVTCPACGQTTVFEEDDLLDGAPKCPGCGKPLDFEVTEE